jgi:hypothetical protein
MAAKNLNKEPWSIALPRKTLRYLLPASFPDVLEQRSRIELTDMKRVGREDLEEQFVRIVTMYPGSQQALLHEQAQELTAEHHGRNVGTRAAMLCQRLRLDSDSLSGSISFLALP